MYDMGKDGRRALNDFLLEGCEMESAFGIQSKAAAGGRTEHSIMTRFDPNNEEHTRFLETMSQIHSGACYIVSQFKGPLKMFDFNAAAPGQTFKSPVYRPRDELTGEYIQGRSPSMFWKLFVRGKPPMVEQTLFTGLDSKPIRWEYLQGVEMKFIPLIHVKNIYVGGGKCSLQMEVVSAIVTSVRARNTTTRQTATIDRLRAARPELVDQVAGQLAKLTMDRQDQMLGAPPMDVGGQQEGDDAQPTFAGITRQPAAPAVMPQITPATGSPQFGALPAIPPLGGAPAQMQDFTAAAPVRPPAVVIPDGGAQIIPGATLQLS
jgi:hypothetical protein